MPAAPRPAATVILLREGAQGPEVLLLKRTGRTRFGPGAYVFPGGAVDRDEAAGVDLSVCPLDDASASTELGIEHGGLAYRLAAIRECFEEAGVMLAQDSAGAPPDFTDAAAGARFDSHRAALRAGRIRLEDLLRREGLRAFGTQLRYVSHWVTPPYAPKRFDTRFFLAEAPPGQHARCCGDETVDECWIRPVDGLAAAERGALDLMTPTRHTLERLAPYTDTTAILAVLDGDPARQGRRNARHGLLHQRFPDPA